MLAPIRRLFRSSSLRGDPRSGNAFIEFGLVFVLMITLLIGMFEFIWVLYIRATLHNAVREGVRFAITGGDGAALDDSVKAVIERNSGGLITGTELDEYVSIEFFDADCPTGASCPAGGAASAGAAQARAGSIVKIAVNCFEVMPITSLIRRDPSTGQRVPFELTVTASDKMEPFPGAPPARGSLASPTACN